MEHGFVKTLYKRCRLNFKKLEDCTAIETKKASGGKVTETQIDKLSKKATYKTDLDADLVNLDLFLKHHVENFASTQQEEPTPEVVKEEPQEDKIVVVEEPVVAEPVEESKEELIPEAKEVV